MFMSTGQSGLTMGETEMYQIDHIRAYYLHRARSIPGGAANTDPFAVAEYWRLIHRWTVADGQVIGLNS
jgi:hypothetical protein